MLRAGEWEQVTRGSVGASGAEHWRLQPAVDDIIDLIASDSSRCHHLITVITVPLSRYLCLRQTCLDGGARFAQPLSNQLSH